ncbi:glycosyl hydrolase [Streptacidiphilus sp. ASG 303]|uniref:glycosyl hydrolase n=1 Tax=Streptacidiphilus sp. ASG 303 TaxID=2896847 RepID=UPI001E3EF5C9|nr:glycosyl hydrolase [Streptacidiphilus sp. ASG 303]MCD0485230.1 glycosyl hydrolase [Streptacidiphilus sp. ASG 303]
MMSKIDFRLDDLSPADEATTRLGSTIWPNDFELLAQHGDAERSFILAFDTTAIWGHPVGEPNITAFDVIRHWQQGIYTPWATEHATPAFAQKWLIERGCPWQALNIPGHEAADELTVRVENRIHCSGDRHQVLARMAIDGEATQGWTMAVDSRAAELPVRLFLEEIQPNHGTYTLGEGAFPSPEVAREWLEEYPGPLPPAPGDADADAAAERISAALAHSAAATPAIATATASATGPTPLAVPAAVAQQGLRRSM